MTVPETSASKRIGVFDSGVGGLSVLREIHGHLPNIPTIYYADQAHLPYGMRTPEDVRQLVDLAAEFLIAHGARVLVIACHTASAASLHELRARHRDIPIVGMEPAVKPAAERTQTGVIGVLTTRVTAQSELYRKVVDRFARGVQVITQPAPELVTMVEQGTQDTPEGEAILRRYVAPLEAAHADYLVLACTHFPFLADKLQALTDIALIDPGAAVARQVTRVLPADVVPADAAHLYYTTGDPAQFQRSLNRLLGIDAPVQQTL